jgi:hypothetical protein
MAKTAHNGAQLFVLHLAIHTRARHSSVAYSLRSPLHLRHKALPVYFGTQGVCLARIVQAPAETVYHNVTPPEYI